MLSRRKIALFAYMILFAAALIWCSASAFAAQSCTLEHPDQDIKRLFPESTHYRVRDLIPLRDAKPDFEATLTRQLGHTLDAEFTTRDTPYTFYAVYKGAKQIGLVLGVNARAEAGPMQIFVCYDLKGKVRDVYVQQISSPDAPAFRSKFYRKQYRRFDLAHLPEEAYALPPVRMPSPVTLRDHHHFIDGVRLNVLLVKYLYNTQP